MFSAPIFQLPGSALHCIALAFIFIYISSHRQTQRETDRLTDRQTHGHRDLQTVPDKRARGRLREDPLAPVSVSTTTLLNVGLGAPMRSSRRRRSNLASSVEALVWHHGPEYTSQVGKDDIREREGRKNIGQCLDRGRRIQGSALVREDEYRVVPWEVLAQYQGLGQSG